MFSNKKIFLYVIEHREQKIGKVGITANLEQRMKQFGAGWTVSFLFLSKKSDVRLLEAMLLEIVRANGRKPKLRVIGRTEMFVIDDLVNVESVIAACIKLQKLYL